MARRILLPTSLRSRPARVVIVVMTVVVTVAIVVIAVIAVVVIPAKINSNV
jgi:hypothetical protein